MDKGRRNELAKLKRKKRLRLYVSNLDYFIGEDGYKIQKPKTTDVENTKFLQVYKSTSVPCSCSMCSPEKYSRKIKHKLKDLV